MRIPKQYTIFFLFSIITFPAFSQQGELKNPLDDLNYDQVIAYNINVDSTVDQHESKLEDIRFDAPYGRSKRLLNLKQIEELYEWTSDTLNFGTRRANCFIPRLAFQFRNNGKEVFRILICEECGYFIATEGFPVTCIREFQYRYEEGGKEVLYRECLEGFSMQGFEKLTQLCASLDMFYYELKERE